MLPHLTIKSDSEATALAWHPYGRVLTVGWDDGKLDRKRERKREV